MKCLYYKQCPHYENEKIICCFAYKHCKQYKSYRSEIEERMELKDIANKLQREKEQLNIGSLL
jgi:hypothetical protein